MSLPIVNVTVVLREQDGGPIVGATVSARADINDIYESFVVPNAESAITDDNGAAVLQCFPNKSQPDGLGLTGSTYRFRAHAASGRKVLDVLAQVPNEDCFLHEIAIYEPLPGVYAIPGPRGPAGSDGPPGSGLSLAGVVANVGLLPANVQSGTGYLIGQNLHVFDGDQWVDAGPIVGQNGANGVDGVDGVNGTNAPEAIFQGSPDNVTWGPVDPTTVYIRMSTDGGTTWSSTRLRGLDGLQGVKGGKGDKGDKGD